MFKYGPYSPSRLATAECGYSFFKQYIDKEKPVKRTEGVPQARGSVVHEVFENITRHMANTPEVLISPNMVRDWVTQSVTRHPAAFQEVTDILDMCNKYISRPIANLNPNVDIELKIGLKIELDENGSPKMYNDVTTFPGQSIARPVFVECGYDDPSAVVRGRADVLMIDAVNNEAILIDHKTQPNIENADTDQMGFYAWVVSKMFPFLTNIKTVLHFARYGVYSAEVDWGPQELFRVEDAVLTKIGITENRMSWEATPHKNCQYCPLIDSCPHMEQFVEMDEKGCKRVKPQNLEILGDTQKAIQIAGFLHIIAESEKRAKENLKNHIEKYGPIALNGVVFEFRDEEDIDWNKVNKKLLPAFFDICQEQNVRPEHFMGLSKTFSSHIWQHANEDFKVKCSNLFPRKASTTFKGWKV